MTKKKTIKAYKCTRASGHDFHRGKVNYAGALASGEAVECLDAAPANGSVCGHGLHVSPTARKTIQFANRNHRPYRWFEGTVQVADIVEQDAEKMRVRRFSPSKELSLTDIFGADFGERVEAVRVEAATWKDIPWLKPGKEATESKIKKLVAEWRKAIEPWLAPGKTLPTKVRIVDNAAAADADADAAAADADAAYRRYWRYRWYMRPRYVLWRLARWKIVGMKEPSPWEPLEKLYRLGCIPIGFSGGAFVVYCPKH